MKIFKIFLILILNFTIFSCSNSTQNKESLNELPKFYVSPTQNDSQNIYGIGEGFNYEEATKTALSDMASRLLVSISSTSTLIREENKSDFNEEIRQNISQNIEKIDFSGFEVSKSQKYNQRIYLEVKVARLQFINLQKEKIVFLDNQIINLQNQLAEQNIVKKRKTLMEILDLARQSEILTRIVFADKDSELSKKLKIISDAKNQLSKLNDKVEFYFENKADSKIYNVIKNSANRERIIVVNNKSNSKNQIQIKINSSKTVVQVYGSYIAKVKISFDNISQNQIIASNSIEVSGSSVVSENEAYNAAIVNLRQKIEKEGVLEILGIL